MWKNKLAEGWNWLAPFLTNLEAKNVIRKHYLILSMVAGFFLGLLPVAAYILGYNYERSKEGRSDIDAAITFLGVAIVGALLRVLVL